MKSRTVDFWIEIDERDDVLCSLRHVLVCLQLVEADHGAWKWLVLALHSALQGSCVCHLLTTAHPIGAVTQKNASEWLAYFDTSRDDPSAEPPKTQLMGLPELLKAIRKESSAGDGSVGSAVAISDRDLQLLINLHNEVRNQFVHFEPRGWLIEVYGLRTVAPVIISIVKEISRNGWAFRHEQDAWRFELNATLDAILASLNELFNRIYRQETFKL